jgi:ammonium transporter Rh
MSGTNSLLPPLVDEKQDELDSIRGGIQALEQAIASKRAEKSVTISHADEEVGVTKAKQPRSFMFAAPMLGLQCIFILLIMMSVEYQDVSETGGAHRLLGGDSGDSGDAAVVGSSVVDGYLDLYPMYQDVHVMIFIGFGFLMVFLQKHGFSSVGFNFMISAVCIQASVLTNGFWHMIATNSFGHKIPMSIETLIKCDFACGAVLITFGAILGKVNPLQLVVIAMIELMVYGGNEYIGAIQLGAVDMGGSIFVHSFGAYFGLGCALMLGMKKASGHKDNTSDKQSDMFAMLGTIFLWMFWPSFNGALATGDQQHRVAINTVLSLSACCMSAFIFSAFFRPENKFCMVDIQNATLAGGVAVGSSADLVIQPAGALAIGTIAGLLSVVGYVYLQPWLEENYGLHDTCGVNNLHGMPGIMGGVAGAISSGLAGDMAYGAKIGTVFPERLTAAEGGSDRTAATQAEMQLCALMVTVLIAFTSGAFTGWVVKRPMFNPPEALFNDEENWELEEEEGHKNV